MVAVGPTQQGGIPMTGNLKRIGEALLVASTTTFGCGAAATDVLDESVQSGISEKADDTAAQADAYYHVFAAGSGYFVQAANGAQTECEMGQPLGGCMVQEVVLSDNAKQALANGREIIVRGRLARSTAGQALVAQTAWVPPTADADQGTLYLATDIGVRCRGDVPCFSTHLWPLNGIGWQGNVSDVDLHQIRASDEWLARAKGDVSSKRGIIVSGDHQNIQTTQGLQVRLPADQCYLLDAKE
jgi:hypothetical protein